MPNYFYDVSDLIHVGFVEHDHEAWQFDTTMVLYNPGLDRFYAVHDSGCSCPTPFERYDTIESLGEPLSFKKLRTYVRALRWHGYDDEQPGYMREQADRVISHAEEIRADTRNP